MKHEEKNLGIFASTPLQSLGGNGYPDLELWEILWTKVLVLKTLVAKLASGSTH